MSEKNQGTPELEPATQIRRLERVVARLKVLTQKYRQAEVIQQALFRISESASSAQNMEQIYRDVHRIIGQLMTAKNFYICLYTEDRKSFTFPYFIDQYDDARMVAEVPAEALMRGMTGYVLRRGEPILCTKHDIEALVEAGEVNFLGSLPVDWLGVPLIANDEFIGAMVVQSYVEEMRYKTEDLELLMFVSQHVVNALERFRHREYLESEVAKRTAELRQTNVELRSEIKEREKAELQNAVLFSISELTNTAEDMSTFYRQLHIEVSRLIQAENFYIALLTENRQQVYFPYYADENGFQARQRSLQKGLTEYVLRNRKPAYVDGKIRDSLVAKGEVVLSESRGILAHQWLGSPLMLDGRIFGVIATQTYAKDKPFSREDLELLNFVAHHVSVAIDRRRASEQLAKANSFLEKRITERTEELVEEIERRKEIEAQLYHDAHHDNLTGLPNRAMFSERVNQALARQKRQPKDNFALLFVDLDRFKNINDTLGHSVGDEFLLEVARRIHSAIREPDFLARLGGDEFVILLEPVKTIDDTKDVASRIIEVMKAPFRLNGQEHFSGASIGIATCRGPDDTTDRLLRDADAAMYEAKNLGRGRYVVFDEAIRSGLVDALNQEAALRHAKAKEDFRLWYQPIFSLDSDTIQGYEMLVRWQRGKETILPGDFMALAERSGAIIDIDQWVLSEACRLMKTRKIGTDAKLPLHVNLCVQHLLRPRHVQALIDLVARKGVPHKSLVLEFDEDALQKEDSRRVLASLRKLKEAGFLLALDDFGRVTGPLHFIYNYPFDIIKLDRNFVAQVDRKDRAQAMVRHIVTLCKELGIELSAEGIETDSQRKELKKLGVTKGQGNLLSAARTIEGANSMPLTKKEEISKANDSAEEAATGNASNDITSAASRVTSQD
ncbi:diguanylate cyclase (GGDEF) domain-containing protein [Idiomarina sp. A28L]|uniref:sensor domain-containing phosphodiesterase n=1 Tax=Idiomarina sp. A28L TaxID=1036674 RepID=UPI000213869A|nr:EAL domain-containing protein [Idiomarina sp. A28L]EGN74208.1 diguanylate cyclase (GGDEF) domain-containing protein [Idiomarina sp. A28L]